MTHGRAAESQRQRLCATPLISKGGSLSYVGTGETLTTLNSTNIISSALERAVGWVLNKAEALAAPPMAVAASADALAHGLCRAQGMGGAPPAFGH